jgi:hypothetical protein
LTAIEAAAYVVDDVIAVPVPSAGEEFGAYAGVSRKGKEEGGVEAIDTS